MIDMLITTPNFVNRAVKCRILGQIGRPIVVSLYVRVQIHPIHPLTLKTKIEDVLLP